MHTYIYFFICFTYSSDRKLPKPIICRMSFLLQEEIWILQPFKPAPFCPCYHTVCLCRCTQGGARICKFIVFAPLCSPYLPQNKFLAAGARMHVCENAIRQGIRVCVIEAGSFESRLCDCVPNNICLNYQI